jgi:adenylate kinase
MRLSLIGPPGSGKGTQAKLLAEGQRLCHFGMGDLLREAVRQDTPAGREAAPFVDKGDLVPDALVNQMIAERFGRDDCTGRFVMDGYPRTRAQAVAFDRLLADLGLRLDAAVQLVVDDDEIVRRLSGRWVCPVCHTPYQSVSSPPRVPGLCDKDGQALIQREDDLEEIVRERLRVYHRTSADLLAYYREHRLLREVRAEGSIDEIYQKILGAVAGGRPGLQECTADGGR